jgi:hypothetical protein
MNIESGMMVKALPAWAMTERRSFFGIFDSLLMRIASFQVDYSEGSKSSIESQECGLFLIELEEYCQFEGLPAPASG